MTRPHPVVRIAAKLTDRLRRRTYQTHIRIGLDDKSEELVVAKEARNDDIHPLVLLLHLRNQVLLILAGQLLKLLLRGNRGDVTDDLGRHLLDVANKTHFQTRSRQLLAVVHRPETVFQVVVLDRRERLNRTETAVVVGKNQTFGRHDLTRTTTAKDDDGIFERSFIHRVDRLGRNLTTLLLQILAVHLLQVRKQPHTLISRSRQGYHSSTERQKQFFHRICFVVYISLFFLLVFLIFSSIFIIIFF